jgi:ammonia channel protein AmtB
MSDSVFALTLALLLLAPLAIAGVALVNTGLGRSRSAAQSILGCLGIVAVAAVVFAMLGATFTSSPEGAGHSFLLFDKNWNWLGAGPANSTPTRPGARLRCSSSFSLWR